MRIVKSSSQRRKGSFFTLQFGGTISTHVGRAPTWGSAAPGRVEKCRPTVSGATRGLSQGGGISEGGPLAIVWACNNQFLKTHKRYIYMVLSLRLFVPHRYDCKSSSIPRSWWIAHSM